MPRQLYINRFCFSFIISLIALSFCLLLVDSVDATQDIKGYKTNGPTREMRYELPALCVRGRTGYQMVAVHFLSGMLVNGKSKPAAEKNPGRAV